MARVLVLGGTGFIGSRLVVELLAEGHEVTVFSRDAVDSRPRASGATYVRGDFLDPREVEAVVREASHVFHLVSTTTPISSADEAAMDVEQNVMATLRLLNQCADARIEKVIFVSTGGAIYGHYPGRPLREDDVTYPVSPYAIGKLSIEGFLRFYRVSRGLDSMVFRISNPYGPGQAAAGGHGLIPTCIQRAMSGLPVTIFGDGSMVRDYVFVDDVARTLATTFAKTTEHHTFNLGSGVGSSVTDIIAAVASALGSDIDVDFQPARPTDVDRVILDVNRLRETFKLEPATIDLPTGIARTVEAAHG